MSGSFRVSGGVAGTRLATPVVLVQMGDKSGELTPEAALDFAAALTKCAYWAQAQAVTGSMFPLARRGEFLELMSARRVEMEDEWGAAAGGLVVALPGDDDDERRI